MELYNVLLVDDEADVLQAMKKKLRKQAVCICRRLFLLQSSLAFQAMFFYNKTY